MLPFRLALLCSLVGLAATAADARPTPPPPVCTSELEPCRLRDSAPVVATRNGQVIEGLRIVAVNRPAVLVRGLANVTIRNLEIFHEGAHGIVCERAPGLTIENVAISHSGAGTMSAEENNIDCDLADGLTVRNARLKGGAAGVYVHESAHVHLSYLEGYDFRGPTPRGMLAQFNQSPYCRLEDFSAINDPKRARTEDNVSVYMSDHCVVRRGLLDGNNGPWSVGVMFEHSRNGLVEDVDTVHQGNGSFSAYPGYNVTFRRTRARDNICADQGRGAPVSGGLVWAGSSDSGRLRIEDSTYFNLCNPKKVWDRASFDVIELAERDFRPRAPIKLDFPWEHDDRR